MWDLIFGHDEALAKWAGQRMPHVGADGFPHGSKAIGVATGQTEHDQLLAVVVYHNYVESYGICEVSIAAASPRWAQRGVIKALLSVPFDQYGLNKLYGTVHSANHRACKLISGLGFKREAVLRSHFGPRQHAAVFGMLRREYEAKWGLERASRSSPS